MSNNHLYIASKTGNVSEVRRLLVRGVLPDQYKHANWYHATALMVASLYGHVDVVSALLQAHSDVHATDDGGYTALHWASQAGHIQVVQVLLAAGSVPGACDHHQCTPLHRASHNGQLAVVRVLLEAGASVSARDDKGHTGLTLAAFQGHTDVADYLISRGSSVQQTDNKGLTALHLGCHEGHINVVRCLIHHGADTCVKSTDQNTTPLHLASSKGHLKVVKVLLEEGGAMDTLKWARYDGQTALQTAQAGGHREVVAYLQAAEREVQVAKMKTNIDNITVYLGAAAIESVDANQVALNKSIGTYRYSDSSYLGGGIFSDVYKGQHKSGREYFAIKIIKWKVSISDLPFEPLREALILKSLPPHRNIVHYVDHIFLPEKKNLAIIMELCHLGDLEDYFRSHIPSLAERVDLMAQASEGLSHLHSQTPVIVHRDLKPSNMLMTRSEGKILLKLGDFGLARFDDCTFLSTFGGTICFIAPEVLPANDKVAYTKEVDIFSLGLVFQAMINFKQGDQSLRPVLEGKPNAKEYIARELRNADILGQPMPAVVVLKDDEDFIFGRVRNLIKHMTRYKVQDRISLSIVQKELKSLHDFL